ncbi:hypothetical protein A2U14_05750 [Fusobacterium necrophorum subsp. funduliforme]|uniref:Replication initiator A N-terminal domain-containing protein n=1 Tax=Fusobacterium necrophorum subsp. funduliforme TaxID=143387 RepID=A0A162J018_9FUSO|nr:replication initiator protein A [Fusobacterium necrophorum]AYV93579.1 hypothetical protein BSQ88_07850 [Fusobacterium necrophorum subsp. funduliforme]KYL04789.1 hypothetical protein A2J07_10370 [Fusobacterium necrophorum subsp. funduliforme]KYM39278.1 hypothetical protein A2U03_08020 [Fusobacterium necrophorum subsp. funduliforme]KYM42546.1 hypothetical protein A2U05_05695 [Fusobacterium necrophorum subsp. funduliforme]KYM48870.1 hypothetical protein A2U04_03615 [Fusobacterium necrophorum s
MEEKEPYFQVPKSLFRLRRDGGISLTAFDIYLLMTDRYKISCLKENIKKFTDEEGEIYFVYAYNTLMKDLNTTKRNGISKAIQELETLGLIRSKKGNGKTTIYYLTSNQKGTGTSNQKGTLIRINNKNNMNKNNYNNYNNNNNNNTILRNEIRLLIQDRNIKVENILKYCNDILRIKEVFEYANTNEKHDAWIIACLRDNYILAKKQEKEEVYEKDYSLTAEDVLRGG